MYHGYLDVVTEPCVRVVDYTPGYYFVCGCTRLFVACNSDDAFVVEESSVWSLIFDHAYFSRACDENSESVCNSVCVSAVAESC